MADAGEIKAKVTIEYDGSGLDQAKEDLAKLADMAGSFGGEGGIGDAISQMGSGFAEGTKGAEGFAESVGAAGEAAKSGAEEVSNLSDALGEHQQAIESVGGAYGALQEPVGTAVSLLETMPEPLGQIAERARTVVTPISDMGNNFAQLQATMDNFALPQFADSLHQVSQAFDPKQFGLDTFAENMQVFQDALVNPEPYSMVQQHLLETGQTWTDFASSIGEERMGTFNQAFFDTNQSLGEMSSNFEQASKSAGAFADNVQATQQVMGGGYESTRAFTEQFLGLGDAAQSTESAIAGAGKASGGFLSSIFGEGGAVGKVGGTFGEIFGGLGDVFGGLMMGLQNIAWPLMSVQMLGSMASSVGSWLYNANLAAEGSNASNPASFTSQIDQLNKNTQNGGNSFATGFGAGLNPSVNAWNYNAQQTPPSGPDFWKGAGQFLGGAVGVLGDLGELAIGSILGGSAGGNISLSGAEGLQNTWAAITGQPLPYPGTDQMGHASPYLQAIGMRSQGYNVTVPPPTPDIGADWSYFQNMPTTYTGPYEAPITRQDVQNRYGGGPITPDQGFWGDLGQGLKTWAGYLNQGGQIPLPFGDNSGGGGIGGFFGGIGQGISSFFGGLGHDFMKIWDPTGDLNNLGYTGGVGAGAGVGNATGMTNYLRSTSGGSMTAGGIGTEAVQLTHTFTANVSWQANNLEHQATAAAHWAESNLEHAATAVANWAEQGVQHAVTAVANWAEQGIQHAVTAVANWTEQNLTHAAQAVANWTEQNVLHPVVAAAQWAEENLQHTATAVASWGEKNLEHLFEGIASWAAQGLEHTFFATASWVMGGGGAPAFADGVSNYSGGPAIVGEAGAEVVGHNGQFMLFDQPSFVNLPSGASVYPMQDLVSSSSSPRQLSGGTVGNVTPVSLGVIGGSRGMPESISVIVQLDSQTFINAIGMPLASVIRVGIGQRGH